MRAGIYFEKGLTAKSLRCKGSLRYYLALHGVLASWRLSIISLVLLLSTIEAGSQTTGPQKMAAFKKQQAMLQQSPYRNLEWRLAGPDNRSGRSTDVAGITGDTNTIYAAFATGGLWKTEDAGKNWTPIFDKEATQSIGNIALAPSDKNVLYVGTGEANIFRASLPGTGMYRSIDAGKSFQHI
jgi:hypothetical protein